MLQLALYYARSMITIRERFIDTYCKLLVAEIGVGRWVGGRMGGWEGGVGANGSVR